MKKELNVRQVCFFIIAFLPVTKFFSVGSVIATYSREDLWISGLICLVLDFITLFALTLFCRNERRDFFTVLEDSLGKTVKNAVLILYLLFFLLKASVPIAEQKDYVECTLYLNMPNVIYFLPFFAFAFFLCTKRLNALGRAADALFPITLVGTLLLFSLSILGADFSSLLPVGANGFYYTVRGSIHALGWFSDGAYFLFFIGNYAVKKGDLKKIFLSFLSHAVIVTLFFMIFFGIFKGTAFRQRFALTEIPSYSTVISNIGRFDYIGIICVLCSALFSLTLPLFFASRIIKEIFGIKNGYLAPFLVSVFALLVVLLSERTSHFLNVLYTVYLPAFFVITGNVLPLFLPLLNRRRNETQKD